MKISFVWVGVILFLKKYMFMFEIYLENIGARQIISAFYPSTMRYNFHYN